METIEITAPNQEEALAKAAEALGVSADQVKITVLEQTRGLFGKPSRIRVKAEAVVPKPAKGKKAKAVEPEPVAVEATPGPEAAAEPEVEAKPAKAERPRRGRSSKSEDGPAAEGAEKSEKPAKGDGEGKEREEVVATEADADAMKGILVNLLNLADMEATVTITGMNGRYINVNIDGSDVGYLVGRRGEVLNALQYLCNVIASRKVTNGIRVTLEGDEYRQRREQILTQMALEVAEEVKKRGEEAVLAPLPAFERRIIHQALVEFAGVGHAPTLVALDQIEAVASFLLP